METGKNMPGVSLQGFIPVRKEPHERSEMVSQVLFGESVEVIDDEGKWLFVNLLNDGYNGWVDKKCIDIVTEISKPAAIVIKNNTKILNLTTGESVILPIGSSVAKLDGDHFSIAGNTFQVNDSGSFAEPGSISLDDLINEVIAIPYLWGGRSGFGFDCSGLTQYLFHAIGISIPRDASEQSAIGNTLSFLNETKTGDLAFFDDTEGMIHHVGMIIGQDRIIHASGTVRIDRLDQQGIFNEKIGDYTHKLRVLKRISN